MAGLDEKPFAQRRLDLNKHSSAIIALDFSADLKYIQSCCQGGELLYFDVSTGKQETSASKMAEYFGALTEDSDEGQFWHTQSCVLGWPVMGIWPIGADGSDINAVDKHVNNKVIASADDFSKVKVFRYPCVQDGSKHLTLSGHSSHVTCVRWAISNHLISTGGNDKCVFIWSMNEC